MAIIRQRLGLRVSVMHWTQVSNQALNGLNRSFTSWEDVASKVVNREPQGQCIPPRSMYHSPQVLRNISFY